MAGRASVVAGAFPWNRSAANETKGKSYRNFSADGLEWDSTGYRFARNKNWKNAKTLDGENIYTKKTKTFYGLDGKRHRKIVYMPKDDYSDNIAFSAGAYGADKELDFADHIFNSEKSNIKTATTTRGHIETVSYAIDDQMLRVSFANGDECTFFGVPWTIGGQLLHYAEYNTIAYRDEHGIERHKLGVEFWNLVRIRGQRVNARYPFAYNHKTNGIYTKGEMKRYNIKISAKDAREYFGKKFANKLNLVKDDELISVVLNDNEMAKLKDELGDFKNIEKASGIDLFEAMYGRDGEWDDENDREYIGGAVDINGRRLSYDSYGNIEGYSDAGTVGYSTDSNNALDFNIFESNDNSELKDFANSIQKRANEIASDFINKNLSKIADRNSWKDIFNSSDYNMRRLINTRSYLNPTVKQIQTYRDLLEIANAIGMQGEVKTWINDNLPTIRMLQHTGKIWTKKMLDEIGNPTVPGNIPLAKAETYNNFIKNGDYLAALNYAKSVKITYIDDDGNVRRRRLIDEHAQLGTED